jgi:anti-sigma B factor antagonist
VALTSSVLHDDGVALVALAGELDLSVVGQLDDAVRETVADGLCLVVIDLGGLSFCDSSGLGGLLRASRVVRSAGGTLLVAGAHGAVQRLLQLTNMERALTLVPDVSAALVALRRAASDAATGPP